VDGSTWRLRLSARLGSGDTAQANGAAARLSPGRSRRRCATASGGGGRRTSRFSMLRDSIRLELGRGGRERCGELIWVLGAARKRGGGSYGGEGRNGCAGEQYYASEGGKGVEEEGAALLTLLRSSGDARAPREGGGAVDPRRVRARQLQRRRSLGFGAKGDDAGRRGVPRGRCGA
jgi:hypothetical protein